jgi:hypothetical protein
MLYDVATWVDTSSNQARKDLVSLRCGYDNLGKIYCFDTVNNVISYAEMRSCQRWRDCLSP